MNNKKKSLKKQIDFYDTFKEQYFKIINEFQFDYEKDCKARDLLSSILKLKEKDLSYNLDNILYSFLSNIHSKKNIFIYGCGPSLERTIDWVIKTSGLDFFKNKINIAADGSALLLREKKIPISAIFTDLDGITREEFKFVDYMVIHGHGDNMDKLEYFRREILDFKNVIGTTPVEPLYNLLNPGGFTDGDRIIYFLRTFLSPMNKVFLIGMDFKNIIGKYSKPYIEKNQEATPLKKKKLMFAVQLIEQILPEFQNDIYFVNTGKISNKFKYLSLEGLIRKLER